MILRMHVAVNCTDLERSLAFYRAFFNAEPSKVKDNYAKFELDEPKLHFSLNVRSYEPNGVLNHLGFQVNDTEQVLAMGERLRQSGLLLIDEMNTTCCYAVQDKVWVYDPDGNAWEIFYTKEDSEFESAGDARDLSLCCAPPSQPVAVTFGGFKKMSEPKAYHALVEGSIFMGGAADVAHMVAQEGIEVVVDLRGEATACAAPDDSVQWVQIALGDNDPQPQDVLFKQAIDAVVAAHEAGHKVAFHCGGGKGRTGTVAAGTLVRLGICATVEEAAEQAKAIRPQIHIKPEQKEALHHIFG